MLIAIPRLLTPEDVAHCRQVLEASDWVDGKVTAGPQSAKAKHNLQVPETAPQAKQLGELILTRLGRNPAFLSAALPAKVYPPLFNRYEVGMTFGSHVDNAIRFGDGTGGGPRYRTDLSCTLFLSDPADYDGGELVIEAAHGPQMAKLGAGDLLVYPANSVHRVQPVTRGARWASVFWVQSMVRDDGQRKLLYDLDQAVIAARTDLGDEHRAVISLTGSYHNLMRMWAEV
jgi:PKHD-type hydroxylase